jgi:putative thioredoxin
MDNKNIINVNEVDFENKVLEESSNKLVVVDFWAPWCGPCKQLTPILEKTISSSPDKIILAKINIDENQQIASQLRIQSIPAVFAFKDKQVVDAFQGVIPESEVIKFLEKCLDDKLENNFDDFYNEIKNLIKQQNFDQAKNQLEGFLSNNSKEVVAISLYLESLIGLNATDSADEFLNSLDEEILKNNEIKKIQQRLVLIKQKNKGPTVDELLNSLNESPKNLDIVFEIADTYFASNKFEDSFEILLKYYPKNKEKIKPKILNYFDVLGFDHDSTVLYRKKLSSIMFS